MSAKPTQEQEKKLRDFLSGVFVWKSRNESPLFHTYYTCVKEEPKKDTWICGKGHYVLDSQMERYYPDYTHLLVCDGIPTVLRTKKYPNYVFSDK